MSTTASMTPATPHRSPETAASVPTVTSDDGQRLVTLALEVIGRTLHTGRRPAPSLSGLPPRLLEPGASFVTLQLSGRLLGCIGALTPYQPLAADVAEHALSAAFDDPRLPPVDRYDYERMSVEVSVLGPQQRLPAAGYDDLVARLRPGTDGVVVAAPGAHATFLPSVWPSVGSREEFTALLWRKAGLPARAWPAGLVVTRYRTVSFERQGPRRL